MTRCLVAAQVREHHSAQPRDVPAPAPAENESPHGLDGSHRPTDLWRQIGGGHRRIRIQERELALGPIWFSHVPSPPTFRFNKSVYNGTSRPPMANRRLSTERHPDARYRRGPRNR